MKKVLFALFTSLLFCISVEKANAQGFTGKGDVMGNIGISFGGNYGYFNYLGSRTVWPPLSGFLEFGIHKYISVGPYLGFATRSFRGWGRIDNLPHSEWYVRETWVVGGVRGTFHFVPLFNEKANANIPEELHIYATVLLGMGYYKKYRRDEVWNVELPDGSVVEPTIGVMVGVRYMFLPNLGVFAEGGQGYFRVGTLGVTFKM